MLFIRLQSFARHCLLVFLSEQPWVNRSILRAFLQEFRWRNKQEKEIQNKTRGGGKMARERVLTSSYSLSSFFVLRFVSHFPSLPAIWTPAIGYKRIRLYPCTSAIWLTLGYRLKPITTPPFGHFSSFCDDCGIEHYFSVTYIIG